MGSRLCVGGLFSELTFSISAVLTRFLFVRLIEPILQVMASMLECSRLLIKTNKLNVSFEGLELNFKVVCFGLGYVMDQGQKNRAQQSNDYGFGNYNRRDRPLRYTSFKPHGTLFENCFRERPTFNHYSSKPQMYAYQSYMQPTICPPPPPPPPPTPIQQTLQQQYYYPRRSC